MTDITPIIEDVRTEQRAQRKDIAKIRERIFNGLSERMERLELAITELQKTLSAGRGKTNKRLFTLGVLAFFVTGFAFVGTILLIMAVGQERVAAFLALLLDRLLLNA